MKRGDWSYEQLRERGEGDDIIALFQDKTKFSIHHWISSHTYSDSTACVLKIKISSNELPMTKISSR